MNSQIAGGYMSEINTANVNDTQDYPPPMSTTKDRFSLISRASSEASSRFGPHYNDDNNNDEHDGDGDARTPTALPTTHYHHTPQHQHQQSLTLANNNNDATSYTYSKGQAPSQASEYTDSMAEASAGGGGLPRIPKIRPNRRIGSQVQLGGIERPVMENRFNASQFAVRRAPMHRHAVENFRSPIGMYSSFCLLRILGDSMADFALVDIMDYQDRSRESSARTGGGGGGHGRNESRYTFNALP